MSTSATIVSSIVGQDNVQKDTRRNVMELHTDSLGVQYQRWYSCAAAFDAVGQLPTSAAIVLAQCAANEIAANVAAIEALGSAAVVTTNYATLAQTIVAARSAFASATQLQAVNLGDWFNAQTFLNLQTAFGFANVSAYNTFKASWFTPNATTAATVRASTGA